MGREGNGKWLWKAVRVAGKEVRLILLGGKDEKACGAVWDVRRVVREGAGGRAGGRGARSSAYCST